MFADPTVTMVWCARGGQNCNSLFDEVDFECIRQNPKIFCGYSDITSLSNAIYSKTGLVTFSGTNFKTIATDETDYSYEETKKRFIEGSLALGQNEEYQVIKEGVVEGIMGVLVCLMNKIFVDINIIMIFLSEVVIGVICYFLILFFLKNELLLEFIDRLHNKIKI